MPLPKKVIPSLPLSPEKILLKRREELLDYVTKNGTNLPKSVLHADLDRGMLDFVKEDLKLIIDGVTVPTVDRIITTQNWSQYTQTALFLDMDYNPSPPFITVVRSLEAKYGTNPSLQYTIPNRKQFFNAYVPTWNGNFQGMDIYTIPQPIPIDLKFSLKIVCNRMRELNQLNKIILQKFSSRQAYRFIKGQYVPIILDNISDESQLNLESRKYYVQTYDFTMLGYLIDEEEFEVKPAVARVLQMVEVDEYVQRKKPILEPPNINNYNMSFLYIIGNSSLSDVIDNRINLNWESSKNITSYDVYINDDFFGTDIINIDLNTNDILRIDVTKLNNSEEGKIIFSTKIV